jgi:mono/diheme cytochrome c family protein
MQSSRWFLALALALGAALGGTGLGPGAVAQSSRPVPDQGTEAGASHGTAATSAAESAPHTTDVTQGRRLYAQLCSHCHGLRMVNPGNSSFDLRKFPHDDKSRFVNSVTHGKNSMPAWGDMLKPEDIEVLWAYVLTGGRS